MIPILAWIIFFFVILAIFGIITLFSFYFSNKTERSYFSIIMTTLGISITIISIAIIPADIYNTSNSDLDDVESRGNVINIIYYILYSLVILFTFVLTPFTYFYSMGLIDEDSTYVKRILSGVKFTVVLVVIVIVLFIVGLFVNSDPPKIKDNKNIEDYLKYFSDANSIETAISFVIFCLTAIGLIIWLTYTSFGLTGWPISYIKGRKTIQAEQKELQEKLEKAQSKKESYSEKRKRRELSKKDKDNVYELEEQEKEVEEKLTKLEQLETGWYKCKNLFSPFQILFGALLLLCSFLIISSMTLSLIDRIINSDCGFKCAFILTSPGTLPNPIDLLLTYSSIYFPIDYIIFSAIISYILFATFKAIHLVGIRFLWIKLFNIKGRKTMPQALVLVSLLLMLATLALNSELINIAPQYITFGSRKFQNGTEFCNMNAPIEECPTSQISRILNGISLSLSFFGIFLYFSGWAFIVTFFLGILIAIFLKRKSNIEKSASSQDWDEWEDEDL
eukprot:TRINITY_DN3856_c0_g1_i1.p1 TRINITY_DN3856_c0_g1~~TRINITY_DN3856_c0_g1_i1.p1  ORF type:complete len:506 (-),score=106.44 TRINITY_DN3856_c0_g1_i1:190-1707(-)